MRYLPHPDMPASLKQARYVLGQLCGDTTDIFADMDRAIENAASLPDDMVRVLRAALGMEVEQ